MAHRGFDRQMTTDDVVHIAGGHDERGGDVAPLDKAAARAAIIARKDTVEAYCHLRLFQRAQPGARATRPRPRHRADRAAGHLRPRADEQAQRRAGTTTVALNAHLILPRRAS